VVDKGKGVVLLLRRQEQLVAQVVVVLMVGRHLPKRLVEQVQQVKVMQVVKET